MTHRDYKVITSIIRRLRPSLSPHEWNVVAEAFAERLWLENKRTFNTEKFLSSCRMETD